MSVKVMGVFNFLFKNCVGKRHRKLSKEASLRYRSMIQVLKIHTYTNDVLRETTFVLYKRLVANPKQNSFVFRYQVLVACCHSWFLSFFIYLK
ncbi:hypothetical protein EG68_01811 [Paragonimus skrjabini miyazakii]|uniref:Uncharacterized protein n=1 Tax=Paragonimus skrjabini miyazakii TaxID=59628 RepID=A0A8S9Z2Q9_9TREM|nr:hypothetical protein EG68_01811 [Paragonimus skrjabini miyazakii]